MSSTSSTIAEFLDTLTEGSERANAELALEVMDALGEPLSLDDMVALVDIFAQGEVAFSDGRQIPVQGRYGMFLAQWFELMVASAPGSGVSVGRLCARFHGLSDEALARSRDHMARRISSLPFVQRVI